MQEREQEISKLNADIERDKLDFERKTTEQLREEYLLFDDFFHGFLVINGSS